MRFTLNWLKDYLDTDASLDQITDKLTAIGLEVEKIIDRSKDLSSFIVVEIIDASPHPNAEKLRICKVTDGKNELQIVCGAANARKGIKVILAPIGAIIPANKMVIKKSKIRDVESEGMLCSAGELMIAGDNGGIIEVDQTIENGTLIVNALGYNDVVIEIAITPNRGDCLGVYGIARDLAAAGSGVLKKLVYPDFESEGASPINIAINTDLCDAFYGIYVEKIKDFKLPSKYTNRLEACGIKSHFGIVDLLNYITHSYNRPMHVYDADTIKGQIEIRLAKDGEKFKALNGKEYILNEELVVADSEKVLALAGIIGSEDSAYSESTSNIFIEIALFDDVIISKAGRKHGIITDARYRFERKLDNLFLKESVDIVINDLKEFAKIASYKNVKFTNKVFEQNILSFNIDKVRNVTGCDIDKGSIINILNNLGFAIDEQGEVLNLTIPSWRNDISIDADVVEEVLRIYGYDKIKLYKLNNDADIPKPAISLKKALISDTRRMLAENGFNEVISWSFMSLEKAKLFTEANENLVLSNPISSELNYMRPSIIPNLIEIAVKNSRRQYHDMAIFEIGNIYKNNNELEESITIAGLKTGNSSSKNIYKDSRKYDVYDIKADCENIVNQLGFNFSKLTLNYLVPKYMHPYRSANLMIGNVNIGYFGQVHPNITSKYELKDDIYIFEIYPSKLPMKSIKNTKYQISDFQAVTRDFAFILSENIEAEKIVKLVEAIDRNLIRKVEIFDLYMGEKLEKGKKSIAFTVTIQAMDKTLNDSEIILISKKIEAVIIEKLDGKLRDS